MKIGSQAGADWRVLFSAALIGSGVGLSLGAGYLAGGMAQHAADRSRVERIAQAAAGGYSDAALAQQAGDMRVAVVRLTDTPAQRPPMADKLRGAQVRKSSELDCMTQAVYYEARGEGPTGQFAVAQVVMNRVKDPAFPKTVCGVVFQGSARRKGCQFSFACDGSLGNRRETSAWKHARQVAARVLAGATIAQIGSATHFHTTNVSPAWGPRMRRVAQVGMHVFYRFSPRGGGQASAPEIEPATLATLEPIGELRLTSAVAETPLVVLPDMPSATAQPPVTAPAEKPGKSAQLETPQPAEAS